MPYRAVLMIGLMVLGWSGAAQAHPHVWIDANVTFVFEQKTLTGVRVEWSFDEIFSTLVIREHDKNRNQKFEPAEIEAVRLNAFVATKEYSHFTHVTVGAGKGDMGEARDFTASIVKGRLVYRFTLPFAKPVDPAALPVAVRAFDESFYVDVGLEPGDPVRFDGMAQGMCYFEISTQPSDLGAFGLTEVKKIELICPKR